MTALDAAHERIEELVRELGLERESHEVTKRMLDEAVRPEVDAPQPQESPLAWLVFTPNHPEGFDYLVFPDEYGADCEVASDPEGEVREVVPLYRTSAFSPQKPIGAVAPQCPDALLPDGPVCPRCGGRRGPSGVDGGTWVHY